MTVQETLTLQHVGPLIEFGDVSLNLGRTTILDAVAFQVQPGSIHALVGPNGGGKSSLIKTLLGQMPHQGRLSLQWPGEPGVIGYVPQALEFDRGLPMTEIGRAHAELQSLMRISYAVFCLKTKKSNYT